MNEYLMLIRENLDNYGKMSPEQMQADIESHVKWVEQLTANGNFKGGNPLTPLGSTLKGKEGMITDGPYVESKEGISGYYFLLANSLEEASGIAKGCPSLQSGGSLELRQIMHMAE
jgi:hypothetical protein